MPEVICKEAFDYPPGTLHQPGDRFEMQDDHTFLFRNAGKLEAKSPDAAPEPDVEEVEPIDDAPDHEEIAGTLHAKRKYTKRQAA